MQNYLKLFLKMVLLINEVFRKEAFDECVKGVERRELGDGWES